MGGKDSKGAYNPLIMMKREEFSDDHLINILSSKLDIDYSLTPVRIFFYFFGIINKTL